MTYQGDITLPTEYLKLLSEQETEYLPELIWILVHAAIQIEHLKKAKTALQRQKEASHPEITGDHPSTNHSDHRRSLCQWHHT